MLPSQHAGHFDTHIIKSWNPKPSGCVALSTLMKTLFSPVFLGSVSGFFSVMMENAYSCITAVVYRYIWGLYGALSLHLNKKTRRRTSLRALYNIQSSALYYEPRFVSYQGILHSKPGLTGTTDWPESDATGRDMMSLTLTRHLASLNTSNSFQLTIVNAYWTQQDQRARTRRGPWQWWRVSCV